MMRIIDIILLAILLFHSDSLGDGRTLLVDDFSAGASARNWMAGDKARITPQDDSLRAEFPAYVPDDPARWPGAARSVGDINLGEFNGLRAELTNPTDLPQPVQINFKDSAGRRTVSVATVPPRSTRTVNADFERMATGAVDWTSVQEISFYRTEPSHVFV